MKIAVFGAGAIGSHLGGVLARHGVDISLIARGPHLEAMRQNGLSLTVRDETFVTHPRVTDDPSTLDAQDYVFVTLKSQQAPAAVDAMLPLLGPDTAVLTAMNGVPWWYFYGVEGPYANRRVDAVDPGGTQWDRIGPERALGCITYVASEVKAPGAVWSGGNLRYYIGEPDGSASARCTRLCDLINEAGLETVMRPDIRRDLWIKIMGNVAYGPVSALTMGTGGPMVNDPDVEALLRRMMAEALDVARALGSDPRASIDDRIENTRNVDPQHKLSMMQDLERGRPMEIEPTIGATVELARLAGVATPTIDTVLALIRLRARLAGLLPG